jgi:hypothetical protein
MEFRNSAFFFSDYIYVFSVTRKINRSSMKSMNSVSWYFRIVPWGKNWISKLVLFKRISCIEFLNDDVQWFLLHSTLILRQITKDERGPLSPVSTESNVINFRGHESLEVSTTVLFSAPFSWDMTPHHWIIGSWLLEGIEYFYLYWTFLTFRTFMYYIPSKCQESITSGARHTPEERSASEALLNKWLM